MTSKTDNIKVSVVIPVYNLQGFIEDTLTNFRNQTLENIEIICINDGSSDDSEKIIKKVMEQDSRVSLINQNNKGAGAARNAGIKAAQGEYIYFFDGDDYCELDFLEKVVGKIEKEDAQIVVFDFYRVDMETGDQTYCNGLNRNLYPRMKPTFNYKDVPKRILSIAIPTPWNKLYKTSYVREKGLKFEEISSTNDITFASISMARADRIAYLPEAFVYYRMNQKGGTITSQKQKKLGNVVIAVESAVRQATELPYAKEIKASIQYFVMDNYIFALQNYAGRFRTSFFRKYYKEIHKRFNSDLFKGVKPEDINNKKRFEDFKKIKANSYGKTGLKMAIRVMKKKLKPLAFRFSLVSVKRFENRHKKTAKELKQIKETLKAQNKDLAFIRKKLNNIEFVENELFALTRNDLVNRKQIEEYNGEGPRIIVSLTTFPGRITTVPNVIENMLTQSLVPDKVVLYLSEENFPNKLEDLPIRLLKLMKHGLEIEWCKGDMRSYKKIIPSLKQYENDILIVVDDDLIYPTDMVETLYNSYKKFPNAISTVRTHRILLDEKGEISPYNEWDKEDSTYVLEPRWDLFATTGAGTLFPPHVFDDEASNVEIIRELCPTADDVWVKFMAMRNQVPVVLATPVKKLRYLAGTQKERLWNINMWDNDTQIIALLEKYGKDMWKVLQYDKEK